jgi:hypothetical protein
VTAYTTQAVEEYGLLLLLPRFYSRDERIDSAGFFGLSADYLILQAKLANWIAAGRKGLMVVSPIM